MQLKLLEQLMRQRALVSHECSQRQPCQQQQGTYTPTQLIAPTSTVNAVVYYTSPAATSGVVRTVTACANSSASSPTFTFCIGTDGASTRVVAAYVLTLNLPAIWNFWLITAQNSSNACGVSGGDNTANHVVSSVGGYQFA